MWTYIKFLLYDRFFHVSAFDYDNQIYLCNFSNLLYTLKDDI